MDFRTTIKFSLLLFISTEFVATKQTDYLAKTAIIRNGDGKPEDTLLQLFATSFDPESGVVSPECQRDSALYRQALAEYKPWALQMYDASTKISSGLVTGNYKQLGNYDECLRVKADNGFVGKACSAQVRFVISPSEDDGNVDKELDMGDLLISVALASGLTNWTSGQSVPYEWLWCVPSSCTSRDVYETIEIGLDPLKRSSRIDFILSVGNDSCHTAESDRAVFDVADWLYIFLLVLFGSIVVASTVYDLVKLHNSDKPDSKAHIKHTILTSFSAYTNGKSLLNVQRGPDSITCLDGLRFLSICWIIYGHTHYLEVVGVKLDLSGVSTMHKSWDTLLLLNGNIVTDTFFLLSGILLSYTEIGRKEKNTESHGMNIWNLYIHRYLRLTPAYAIIIGFYATIFYKLGSGPHWSTWVGANRDYCKDNWWTNLLYVNNYVNVADMCMSQSWYLSVDMQLIWLSPILLYPMLGNGKKLQLIFYTILATVFLVSILAPLLITYFNELTGTMLYYKDQTDVADVYLEIYTKTYTRAAPYLLGFGLGYLLRKIKPSNTRLPIAFTITGWTIAITAGLAVVFGPRGMYFADYDYNGMEAAFYAGLHRPVFALAVGWIIFASVFGCAGPVGTFLSWCGWVPLSKLTYSAYLCHYIILLYNAGTVRSPGNLTTFGVVQTFFGNLAITLVVSVILSLCFEIPFVRLDRLLISKTHQPSFTSAKFIPGQAVLGTSGSNLEIYRSIEDATSTVSRTYKDLLDRYAKVSIDSFNRSQSSNMGSSSPEPSSSFSVDFHGIYPPHQTSVESKVTDNSVAKANETGNGIVNAEFEKTA